MSECSHEHKVSSCLMCISKMSQELMEYRLLEQNITTALEVIRIQSEAIEEIAEYKESGISACSERNFLIRLKNDKFVKPKTLAREVQEKVKPLLEKL